jgi:hypothetical protein
LRFLDQGCRVGDGAWRPSRRAAADVEGNDALGTILDSWTLQATAGFNGCVSPNLDKTLADPGLMSLVIAGLHRVLAKLPADGLVNAADPWLIERAERVTDGARWRCPSASAPWVIDQLAMPTWFRSEAGFAARVPAGLSAGPAEGGEWPRGAGLGVAAKQRAG